MYRTLSSFPTLRQSSENRCETLFLLLSLLNARRADVFVKTLARLPRFQI
jgi:hypothetical protein